MAEKTETSRKKHRKTSDKVRVKLPGIESYEKTLVFAAEGPGRVVVRLERLMGSDRIRITDPKYLSTLIERLEAEEAEAWGSRSRLRKKAEKNRSRQLAIEGLMEPAEDMLDLYEHPVFRVNRVLNRLATFDMNMGGGAVIKGPPIVQVDLFNTEDDTGKVFKSYPQHQIFHQQTLPYQQVRYSRSSARQSRAHLARTSHVSRSRDSASQSQVGRGTGVSSAQSSKRRSTPGKRVKSAKSIYRAEGKFSPTSHRPSELDVSGKPRPLSKMSTSPSTSLKSNLKHKSNLRAHNRKNLKGDLKKPEEGRKEGKNKEDEFELEEEEEEGEYEEEDYDNETYKGYERDEPPEATESLHDFMTIYGVPSDQSLTQDWQAFRSHLVERVYEENGGSAEELYELAGEVIGTYDRQLQTVDEFVDAREEAVKTQRIVLGLPSDRKLADKKMAENKMDEKKMAEKKKAEKRGMKLEAGGDIEGERDDDDERDDERDDKEEGEEYGEGDVEEDGEGEDDDQAADKHWASSAWSKNKSKTTTQGASKSQVSEAKSHVSGQQNDGQEEDEEEEMEGEVDYEEENEE